MVIVLFDEPQPATGPDEIEACGMGPRERFDCGAYHNGYSCTRPRAHAGPHIAGCMRPTIVYGWQEVPDTQSPGDHPDPDVQRAITALCDALCTWERATGIESALILREQGGFSFRAMSGKPGIAEDVTDEQLLSTVK